MPGSDGIDRRRYARHLLLAEIGEQGQARLCASRVRIPPHADPRAAAVTLDYLNRAGPSVLHDSPSPSLADAPVPTPAAVATLAGTPELEEAAAALAGAFAAVETIKDILGLPRAELPRELRLRFEVPA